MSEDKKAVIEKFSPVTGELLGTFPITDRVGVEAAVERAKKAFPAWRDTPIRVRLKILGQLKRVIETQGEAYAKRISQDTGKPYVDSLITELFMLPLFLDYYAKIAPKTLKRRRMRTNPVIFPHKSSYVEYFPMGVVAVISPWNFPFQLAVIPVITALIAGNTVVLKPSEVTPITGEIIREMFAAIDLPEGIVEVIQGDGSTGAALTNADIDKIFFTGSVETGRKVMAAAAKKPIPVELELGGKDPFIVCADAHLERAAKAAVWGGFVNCGQMCTSVERVLVVESVHDRFVELVEKEVAALKVGAPEEHADMGPMTFKKQIDTVEAHIKDAIERGATVLLGGKKLDRKGDFFAPTLLKDVTPEMEIYREETFGPVLPIIKVRSDEEAIAFANDHQFGLTASVWSKDIKRAKRIASRLECGQVNINDTVVSVGNYALPFGGVKSSGFGRYHGVEGLKSFSHERALMVDRGRGIVEPLWFPYVGKYSHLIKMFSGLVRGNLIKAGTAFLRLTKVSRDNL